MSLKIHTTLCSAFLLLSSTFAYADPILITGTPGDAYSLPNTPSSPHLTGADVNFDNLTACQTYPTCSTVNTLTSGNFTFSSPDGLAVLPYSSLSAPNDLWDASSDGSANLTINYASGTSALAVGILDSDLDINNNPVNIVLQALDVNGNALGSAFTINIPENTGDTAGTGYYVVEDATAAIYGLQITTGATGQSGLAIDDVEAAPEPSTFLLLTAGAALFGASRLRKRA